MEIKIEDLQKGDEIIIPCNSGLKYLKLLKTPEINKRTTRWKAVPCTTSRDVRQTSSVWGGKTYVRTWTTYKCRPPEEHNCTISQNLVYKTIWLVRREN